MRLLCDLGGTHIRFGISDSTGALQAPMKFSASDFSGFSDAVSHYLMQQNLSAIDGILIAATGKLSRPWALEAGGLKKQGLKVIGEVSDFEAAAWAAPHLAGEQLITIREGVSNREDPRLILGPGTGLGLAYMLPEKNGQWRIQKTHGGHMQAALQNEEHMLLAALIARLRGNDRSIIYENFVSGRNLPLLYRAVCAMQGETEEDTSNAEELLKRDMTPALEATLRIFHEMLGLFAHSSVVTLNAYGGVYLDGGMVQRLRERNLFDVETVLLFMTLNPVVTVREDLDRTPVWLTNDPFIALRGLIHMDRAGQFQEHKI